MALAADVDVCAAVGVAVAALATGVGERINESSFDSSLSAPDASYAVTAKYWIGPAERLVTMYGIVPSTSGAGAPTSMPESYG